MRDPETLIIGDLHLRDDIPGYLESQCEFVKNTILEFKKDELHSVSNTVIFLGDVFDKRNPSVKVMLALKKLLDEITDTYNDGKFGVFVHIIRGNHDSVSKADDGLTALSLFEQPRVTVHTDFYSNEKDEDTLAIIPHYENEETIKKHLSSIKYKTTAVFGHFGYHGSLNSAGDNDFRIPLECFNNLTFLGHIHHYSTKDNVVVVGTPYTTSFQEAGKPNYVVYCKNTLTRRRRRYSWEAVPAVGGPKHHVCKLEDLPSLKLDSANFNLVRVMVNPLKEGTEMDLIATIKEKYPLINWVDIRFDTVANYKKEEQSYYRPERELFNINEAIIEDYIDSSPTQLNKEDLLSGLKELNEDQ